MVSNQTQSVALRAKAMYESRWRARLESEQRNKYIAIEPDAGEYFLGDTFSDAVQAARLSHPDRISFVIRIGHEAAIHMGAISN